MIRRATKGDIKPIVRLELKSLSAADHGNLVVSPDRVKAVLMECLTNPRSFAWVAEVDGEIKGALCALVEECLFYERQAATVVMFYSEMRGEGVKMLRTLMRWAKSRPGIKIVAFTPPFGADPRIGHLLTRAGLETSLPVYTRIF